ncbi:MAG: hypothetical protein HXS48_24375 [Theionarchaea archaeon]|nr:hypothetical protein [Theionarchaea archaeon]
MGSRYNKVKGCDTMEEITDNEKRKREQNPKRAKKSQERPPVDRSGLPG